MPNGKRNKVANRNDRKVESSKGNVFADLAIPNPDLALAKAELVQRIRELIAERKLPQSQTAALLGIDQPKVSSLLRGDVAGYSIDRLFRLLNALGQRVEITLISAAAPNRRSGAGRGILVLHH